jgi:membrane-associated phospholipid phosphatase
MEPIWEWGNDVIVSIQAVHNPALDGFFNAITFLGEPEFFLIFFPLIVWTINKSIGLRLTYLGLISLMVMTWVKSAIGHPRPYEWPTTETSPALKLNQKAYGPGMPSGHTQLSLTIWFYLAYHFKRPWLWVVAAILFILVSFSRIYLGVHFPTDLLGGILLGLIVLLLFIRFEDALANILQNQTVWVQIGLAIVLPFLPILIYHHPDIVSLCSTLTGLSLGIIFDNHKIGFEVTGSILRRAARYIVGIIVLIIIYFGLRRIVPAPEHILHTPLDILRYVIAGFWISGGALWLFKRINLA